MLKDINLTGSPHVREAVQTSVAEEYAEQYKEKKHGMPDPVLFKVGKEYLIGDGLHRVTAMNLVCLKAAVFDVREGTRADCVKFALTANINHGLRRSNADKRQGVRCALMEFPDYSDETIASVAAVDRSMVPDIRQKLIVEAVIPPPKAVKGKDGKVYPVRNKKPINVEATVEKDKSAVPERKQIPDKVEVQFDETGYPIPPDLLPIFSRKKEAVALLKALSDVRCLIKTVWEADDPLYREVKFNPIKADLDRAYDGLTVAIPYCVCLSCNGKFSNKCKACNGTGIVSRLMYRRFSEELRSMRDRAVEAMKGSK